MKKLLCSILLLCNAMMITSCSKEETTDHLKDAIIVATSADNPVYEFIQDGKVVGMDIDIINAIGQVLGKKIIIKNIDFPGLFPALSSGNVDLVIAAISVTEERNKYFDFSDTYASSHLGLLYKDDNIKSLSDIANKTIGAQLGSTWEQAANDLAKTMSGLLVRSLANNLVLVEELKHGTIDAVVAEDIQLNKFMQNNPGLKRMELPEYVSTFAIVGKKDSPLIEHVNQAIIKLRNDGTLDKIKRHWIK